MATAQKIFIAIMIVVAGANAAVLTHQETFDNVKVFYPAKSTKTTCKTRVDLSEGLVDNTLGCDVEEIWVYNKNRMWIGSLDGVEAGYNLRYADYDVDRYKGKGTQISVKYSFTAMDADPENRWMVSCPKGMVAYIDEDFFRCRKAYSCPDGMYATDSTDCAELPSDAHRNKTAGFTCNKGYVLHDDYCEEKIQCNKNDRYDPETNSCVELPENAHWVKNTKQWDCNEGYVYQNTFCEQKAVCDTNARYDVSNNSCVDLPENAKWVNTTSTDWSCKSGFMYLAGRCEEKATCSVMQRYDETSNICIDPFPHSRWRGHGADYVCDEGYVDVSYGQCEEKADCDHYNESNNSCYEKPEHSHWRYSYGDEWDCDNGFVNIGGYCETKATCAHYDEETNSCFEKPEHSYWVDSTGADWECDDGYWNNGNFCEDQVSCGWFERYNPNRNTCVSKPPHSHWIDEWEYACDDGYATDYNGDCYDANPINLADHIHFTHDIGTDLGGASFKDNYDDTQAMINAGIDYNVGIKLGSDDVNVRLQGTIGLFYTYLEYDAEQYDITPEEITSILFLYGLNVGIDLWRIAIDYSYLLTNQDNLENIKFNETLHKIRFGVKLNEHWKIHLAAIPKLISSTTVMKSYTNTWYHLGLTYRF